MRSLNFPIFERNLRALTRSECCHHCGFCDGQLSIPENRRVIQGTFHNGQNSCSAKEEKNKRFIANSLTSPLLFFNGLKTPH